MQPRRSGGITTTAIVEALLGIFAIIGGTAHLLLGVAGGIVGFNGQDINLGTSGDLLYGYTFTVEGLVLLAAAAGVWNRKKWAWTLAAAINIIGLVTSIIALAIGSALAVPGIIVNLVLIYYLTRRPTKAHFGIGVTTTPTSPK